MTFKEFQKIIKERKHNTIKVATMKTSRHRRLSICLTDLEKIPPEKITVAGNGKKYISLTTWDYSDGHTNDHDFSVSITRSPKEKEEGIPILYIGGGLIIEN